MSMCENIKINVVNLYPGDTIIAHLGEDVSVDEARQIHQALNKLFPNNTVNVINNYFVKEFTIFSEHDQNPFLRGVL